MKRIFAALMLILLKVPAAEHAPDDSLKKVQEQPKISWQEYLKNSAVSREVIDAFLRGLGWAQFDPEIGYIQGN